MKRTFIVLAVSALLALGGQAYAELCTIDQVPAATLLLPYFAVDVSDAACDNRGSGIDTLFTVNNASAAPTIAHVTMWTDWSIPTLDFDIYLTGYDVQAVGMFDVFCNGDLPSTGAGVSNQGIYSQPNIAYPSCNNGTTPGAAPVYAPGVLNSVPGLLPHITAYHTGQQSPSTGFCAGSGGEGDFIATGYITVDQTNDCSVLFPSQPAYYDPASPLGFTNQLWGDYFYAAPDQNFAQGFPMVHIEAGDFVTGDVTFYGRYNATSGADLREPLGTTYAARYVNTGGFDGTDFFIWREGDSSAGDVACGSAPSWYPLGTDNQSGAGALIAFDEEENVFVVPPPPISCDPVVCQPETEILIPNETQRVEVGDGLALPTSGFTAGWFYLNLQHYKSEYGAQDGFGQAWVTQRLRNSGRYSSGWNALQLDTACAGGAIVTNPDEPGAN